MPSLNAFVLRHIRAIEMIGVLMRIFSFSLVSWMGPASPFMFVWVFNTVDAVLIQLRAFPASPAACRPATAAR